MINSTYSFDPWFSLKEEKIGETEYGIVGYHLWLKKIAGNGRSKVWIQNNWKTTQGQPWEFRTKPAWQRLIIMLGGIFVNLILAWAIYTGIEFVCW